MKDSIVKEGIIYAIRNKKTHNYYIGQTIFPLFDRMNDHILNSLNFKDESLIHQAIEYYGEENFEVAILESKISIYDLDNKEIEYIKLFNSYKQGYNSTLGGKNVNFLKNKGTDLIKIDSVVNTTANKYWSNIKKEDIKSLEIFKTRAAEYKRISQEDVTEEIIESIIGLLKEKEMRDRTIAKYSNVTTGVVKRINRGLAFREISEKLGVKIFPIRSECEIKRKYLNEKQVLEIVTHIKENKLTLEEIADLFDIAFEVVQRINVGNSYKIYTSGESYPIRKKAVNRINREFFEENFATLSKQDIYEIIDLLKYTKFLISEIAEEYNVLSSAISAINRGVNWKVYTNNEQFPIRKYRYRYKPGKIGGSNAVITEQVANEIADMLEHTNKSNIEIATKYGVNPCLVSTINTGLAWKRTTKRKKYPIRSNLLNLEQIFEIVELLKDNKLSIKDISKKFAVSELQIRNINNGHVWKKVLTEYSFPIRILEYGIGNRVINKNTAESVMELLIENKVGQKDIAKLLNITEGIVSSINTGRSWRCVLPEGYNYPIRNKNISNEVIKSIAKLLLESKLTYDNITEKYDVSKGTIRNINNGMYKHILNNYKFPIREYSMINESKIIEIAELLSNTKIALIEISNICGVSNTTVSYINSGKQSRRILENKYTFPIRLLKNKEEEKVRILEIAETLNYTRKSCTVIAEEFDVSVSKVISINNGKYNKSILSHYTFPIRKENVKHKINDIIAKKIGDEIINTNLKLIEIAKLNRVEKGIVNSINQGKAWSHVFDNDQTFPLRSRFIKDELIEQIIKHIQVYKDDSFRKIAEIFKVSNSTVNNINKGKIKSNILEKYEFPIRKI